MTPMTRMNQNWLPSIFNDLFDNNWVVSSNTTPAINVIEDKDKYEVEVAAPGMAKDDFRIHITQDGELVIGVEKKTQTEDKQNKKYLRREFSYSKFEQSILLPDNVERSRIEAKVNDGVLTVTLPKKTEEEKARALTSIEIK
ncbi:MAG TPA: heat-shock protein [Bacteroidales bacterium]|nr:heat-shock protein [Bacteroidales bacterium]